jgi:hypothetical protein
MRFFGKKEKKILIYKKPPAKKWQPGAIPAGEQKKQHQKKITRHEKRNN